MTKRAAAVVDTERVVRAAASRAGRALTELPVEDLDDFAGDPLAQRAVAIYLALRSRGRIDPCPHLVDEVPAPRWWSSALPNRVWCGRGPCTVLAVTFVMQAHGLLPTTCAVCVVAPAQPRLDVALDDVRLVLHTCLPCFRGLTPGTLGEAIG